MADIDLTQIVYDPAVGVSVEEEMSTALLHKAVKNPLFTGYTWTPFYCNAYDLAGGITLYVPVILPGAKVEVCAISENGVFCEIFDGEDSLGAWLSNDQFTEPMESYLSGTGSLVLEAVPAPTRTVVLMVTPTVRAFVAFYRLIGGE